jgi:hypothetical protein|tara:strand:+ start:125 stop:412 length:288 start_codon:yes stop_codon:yes gene_type:complete
MIIRTKGRLSYCCHEKNVAPDHRHRSFEALFLQDKSPGACRDAVFAEATVNFQLVWQTASLGQAKRRLIEISSNNLDLSGVEHGELARGPAGSIT